MYSTIDDVDEKLRYGNPSSKIPAYIVWFLILIYWGFGTYWLMRNLIESSPLMIAIMSFLAISVLPMIIGNISLIISYLTILIATIFIVSFTLLILIRKTARIVLMIVLVLSLIFNIGVGVTLVLLGSINIGIIPLAISLILGYILFRYWDRIKFTGRLMELSSSVIMREKGTLLSTILSMIINTYTLITMSFTNLFVGDLVIQITNNTQYGFYAGIILEFLGLWSIAFISTYFNAIIVGITHDWYRSPRVDIASFGRGLRRANRVQGGLAIYAFIISVLRILIEVAKSQARSGRGKSGAGAFLAFLAAIIAKLLDIALELFKFFSFFIVPAMVIRETNFKDGFKESLNKLRDLFIEVIATEIGFGTVAAIFTLLYLMFLGGIGYLIGAYVITPIFLIQYNISGVTVGIISAVIYFLIGLIPASVIFGTLSVVFNTLLYEYGIDLEFAKKGETLPRNMPVDVEHEFREILRKRGINIPLPPPQT